MPRSRASSPSRAARPTCWSSGLRGRPYRSYTVRADGGPEEPGFPKDLPANVQVTGPEVIPFLPSGAAKLDSPQVEVIFTGGAAVATLRVLQATGYARVDPP